MLRPCIASLKLHGEYRVESQGIIAQRRSTSTGEADAVVWHDNVRQSVFTPHRSCWNKPRLIRRWLQRLWILWVLSGTATAALTIFIGAMFCSGGTSWGQRMKQGALDSADRRAKCGETKCGKRNAKCEMQKVALSKPPTLEMNLHDRPEWSRRRPHRHG